MSAAILGDNYNRPPASILLLEADSIGGVADGGAIATWPDTSINGNNATQSAAGSKPLWRATGGPNSKPAVEFDGSNDSMALASAIAGASIPAVLAVIKLAAAGTNRTVIGNLHSVGSYHFRCNTADKMELLSNGVASVGTATTALGTSSYYLVEIAYDGSTFTFTLNGTADGTGSKSQTFAAATDDIGDTVTAEPFTTRIAALAICLAVNQVAMRTYLNKKYRIF